MECTREINKQRCTCTYIGCDKRGYCCKCVEYHRALGQIPGCFFPPEAERSYDRSIKKFIESVKK